MEILSNITAVSENEQVYKALMEAKILEKCPQSDCGRQQIPAVSVAFSLAIMSVEIEVTMAIGLFIWWSTHC